MKRSGKMRFISTQYRGSISVFFSMTFLFILVFFGALLLFCSRVQQKTQVRADLDSAGFSVLSEYRQDWVREYGLYMVPESCILPGIEFYMDQNADHAWGRYTVDNLTLTEKQTLQDPEVLQKQILSFMAERGYLDLIGEMMETMGQLQDSQAVTQNINWEETEKLQRIQSLYAQLVTDTEGLRSDGTKNPYSILHLLEADPSYEEVLSAMQAVRPTSQQAGTLERAYDELDQTALLCEDAIHASEALIEAIQQLEEPEMLPITVQELERYQKIWKTDQKLCVEASAAIQGWLGQIEEDRPQPEAFLEPVLRLSSYDRSAKLPYEYRESEQEWDLNGIWARMKGYSVDVSAIAPDQTLDLGLEENQQEAQVDLQQVSLDYSFQSLFLTVEYSLGIFRNFREAAGEMEGCAAYNLRGEVIGNRFFNNETEYLIVGRNNEYENVDGVRQRIVLLRTALNMAYLLTDTEKRMEIEAIANTVGGILLPGIGNGVIFAAVLVLWSTGEAIMDYQTLIENGRIPLWKDDASWQTDLSSILSESVQEKTKQQNGLTYEQYLRFLLYTVGQDTLISRIQNLLYLNHQKRSLMEAVTGFSIEGQARGNGYTLDFSGEYTYEIYQ